MVDRLVNSEANARRIAMVENCFGGSGQPLAVPGRVLVGEGVLTKMCRKKPKPRQFFLFNDILVYGNIVINKKKYNKQHIIPLEEVKLESLADEGQYRNGSWWLIKTCSNKVVCCLRCYRNREARMDGTYHTKCIEDLLRKSGKKPVEIHAAVWVPDNEATIHSIKQTGERDNGKVVRVCLQCYDAASKIKAVPTTAVNSLNNKDQQRNSADSSGGDSSGDDDERNEEES
ncbi:pleckstrin homology domain-containing family f member 2-like protein [Lasius niger]|uniref:Pleckstrin homology domain-containing family f member 2-like protein n=1 Tax=Lasius niger TaxID=67767 RepID=A0A0J7KM98_LASNI|nr:pleckstrin homology domain-containing family f member 2-like protein [Lasius niger]